MVHSHRLGYAAVLLAALVTLSGASAAPVRAPDVAFALAQHRNTKCPVWPSGSGILRDGDLHEAQNPGGWQTFYRGEGLAPDWTVTKRSSDLYGSNVNKFPYGICSIDLDGYHPGAVKTKSFPTAPSATYMVTFLFSGNGGGPPTIKTMQIEAAGQSTTLQWNTSSGQSAENGIYEAESWTFTAVSLRTNLKFTSLDPNAHIAGWGPVIAAIAVTQQSGPKN